MLISMEIIVYDASHPAALQRFPQISQLRSQLPDPLGNFHTRRGDLAEQLWLWLWLQLNSTLAVIEVG